MKPFYQILATSVIFFIFGWVVRGKRVENNHTSESHYYTRDSISYKPRLISETNTKWIPLIQYVDTSKLEQSFIDSVLASVNQKQLVYVADDYFTKRFYSDTLGDSTYTLVLQDSVWKNSLVWRHSDIKVKHTVKTITKPSRGYLTLGVFGGYSKDFQTLGGTIGFTTKNRLYIGYGFSPFNQYHTIHISKGLSFKK